MTSTSSGFETLEQERKYDHSENGAPAIRSKSKRFRFKSKSRSSHDGNKESPAPPRSEDRKHRHHHHGSRHPSKRRKTAHTTPLDDPSSYDDSTHALPPESAFRESLFDALGDDEGAAFWEGVYGQPIHTYPDTYRDEQTGELEKMTDEEYATFVRRKMWEKSWEGIEEERQQRRKRRREEEVEEGARQTSGETPKVHGRNVFDKDIEASLRRGEERRSKKKWASSWKEYLNGWNELQDFIKEWKDSGQREEEVVYLRNKIIWPVESGKRKDVRPEEIEKFMINGVWSAHAENGDSNDAALMSALKLERVRWHPDKMQQRYGSMEVDEGTAKGVTAVFQVLDRMWNERKENR